MKTKIKNGKIAFYEKVRLLIGLRAELEEIKSAHKQNVTPLENGILSLSDEIKTEMKAQHIQSFRTEYGTPYISIRHTPYVVDESKVIGWLKEKKLDKGNVAPRLTNYFYEKFLKDEATRVVKPDGVEIRESEVFGIRKPEEKNGQEN